MTTIEDIASELRNSEANIQLIYAFNSVGKTRLSVAYKNATKNEDGTHAGIYYNAYSKQALTRIKLSPPGTIGNSEKCAWTHRLQS